MKKGAIILIAIIIAIPIMWYLLSPLIINKVVDEELPRSTNNQNEQNIGEDIQVTIIEQDVEYQGNFKDADSFHKVKGQVKVLKIDNKNYLSLENFESTNGPDLKIYLSEDLNANSFVNLGKLKGNIGNQNYEIPENTDLEKYKHALIWCERFSVLFGSAELN